MDRCERCDRLECQRVAMGRAAFDASFAFGRGSMGPDHEQLAAEMKAAHARRDAAEAACVAVDWRARALSAVHARDAAIGERDEAVRQRDIAVGASVALHALDQLPDGIVAAPQIGGRVAAVIAESFAQFLDEKGGINYVEIQFADSKSGGRYVLNLRRPSGKTPNELQREAEAERDTALALARKVEWRTEPPTVDEVQACQWWWACTPGVTEPHALALDIDEDDTGEWIGIVGDDAGEFVPADWGTHFAPCLPPAVNAVPALAGAVGKGSK